MYSKGLSAATAGVVLATTSVTASDVVAASTSSRENRSAGFVLPVSSKLGAVSTNCVYVV